MEGAQVEVGTTLRSLGPRSCRGECWLGLGAGSGGAEAPWGWELQHSLADHTRWSEGCRSGPLFYFQEVLVGMGSVEQVWRTGSF